VVIGEKRERITALINIDMPIVGKWPRSSASATRRTRTFSKPDLRAHRAQVRRVNATLAKINPRAVISKFVRLYKELDATTTELSARKRWAAAYRRALQDVIEAMYDGREAVAIDATIKFQDGRTARIKTTVAVRDVAGGAEA